MHEELIHFQGLFFSYLALFWYRLKTWYSRYFVHAQEDNKALFQTK